MQRFRFPALCLLLGLVIFTASYSLLGLSQNNNHSAYKQSESPEKTDGAKLTTAIIFNDSQTLKDLLQSGADPNSLNDASFLPLQIVLFRAKHSPIAYSMVKLLLDYGANPNLPDPNGLSPMHIAAQQGTEAIMTALLDAGGDPSLPINDQTPYILALNRANTGALAAIKKAFPHLKTTDAQRSEDERASGLISAAIMDIIRLHRKQDRLSRLKKLKVELIRIGYLTPEEAEILRQKLLKKIQQTIQERRSPE